MNIYALGDKTPQLPPAGEYWIAPGASVIGDVILKRNASVWFGAVVRGDNDPITIGENSNIQDGSVLHCSDELTTVVGDECVVGHIVHLEGCVVEDRALVGNGAVVLHGAVIRTGSLVGSNAVVPAGMDVPTGAMALGVPAKLREGVVSVDMIRWSMQSYVDRARRYRAELRVVTRELGTRRSGGAGGDPRVGPAGDAGGPEDEHQRGHGPHEPRSLAEPARPRQAVPQRRCEPDDPAVHEERDGEGPQHVVVERPGDIEVDEGTDRPGRAAADAVTAGHRLEGAERERAGVGVEQRDDDAPPERGGADEEGVAQALGPPLWAAGGRDRRG